MLDANMSPSPAEVTPPPDRRGPHNLDVVLDMAMEAVLHFGAADMKLREVLALGPGDIVELDRQAGEPVDLIVGDRIVARGEVVVVRGSFALRVTEVAAPQMRLESAR